MRKAKRWKGEGRHSRRVVRRSWRFEIRKRENSSNASASSELGGGDVSPRGEGRDWREKSGEGRCTLT